MFFSNRRFSGFFILISVALILSLALPPAASSQEVAGQIRHKGKVIEYDSVEFRKLFTQMHEQMAKLHAEKQKMAQALQEAHQELQLRRQTTKPPLEDTQTQVFHVKHVDGALVRKAISEILGSDLFRMTMGASRQTMVIRAREETLAIAESLIAEMDRPKIESKAKKPSELPRSLMVRIFWLSDGATNSDTQPAQKYFPDSVINALQQVSIEVPHIVLQSNTSITLEENEIEANFEVRELPAILFEEWVRFNAKGEVHPTESNRLRLSIEASTAIKGRKEGIKESHVSGSIIAPLKHFVVLGTGNYIIPSDDNGNYSNSQFAYVVQVVEAKSFAPEK